jgi:hypothetical protein
MRKTNEAILARMAERETKGVKSIEEIIRENADKVTVIETRTPSFTKAIRTKATGARGTYYDKVYSARSKLLSK